MNEEQMKIEALKERIGQMSQQWADEVATLRVALTVTLEQLNKLKAENVQEQEEV